MEAASRNRVLMVGGGIVLVILLLMCGPLEGQFGRDAKQDTPDVAAAPPATEMGAAAGAAAAGAAAGAAIGATDFSGINGGVDGADLDSAGTTGEDLGAAGASAGTGAGDLAAAGAGIAGAGAGATVAGTTGGGGSGASTSAPRAGGSGAGSARARAPSPKPPAVSAGVPAPMPPAGPTAAELADAAAKSFDVAASGMGGTGIGIAGKVVDRFAPPVESGPVNRPLDLARRDGFGGGSVLRACDSPGAGCANLNAVGSITPTAVNPPITSFGRPPRTGTGGI